MMDMLGVKVVHAVFLLDLYVMRITHITHITYVEMVLIKRTVVGNKISC